MKQPVHPLYKRFPPSESCSCDICTSYCLRPGWPLVQEARMAIENGQANRLMIEFSTDYAFGILVPAFRGNEGLYALDIYSHNGCTFLTSSGCLIFETRYRPLECCFCHHARNGLGLSCHLQIARDWNTSKGKRLVQRWLAMQHLKYPRSFTEIINGEMKHRFAERPFGQG